MGKDRKTNSARSSPVGGVVEVPAVYSQDGMTFVEVKARLTHRTLVLVGSSSSSTSMRVSLKDVFFITTNKQRSSYGKHLVVHNTKLTFSDRSELQIQTEPQLNFARTLKDIWESRHIQLALQLEPRHPSPQDSPDLGEVATQYCLQCAELFNGKPIINDLVEMFLELSEELCSNTFLKTAVCSSGDLIVFVFYFVQDMLSKSPTGKIAYCRDSSFRELFPFDAVHDLGPSTKTDTKITAKRKRGTELPSTTMLAAQGEEATNYLLTLLARRIDMLRSAFMVLSAVFLCSELIENRNNIVSSQGVLDLNHWLSLCCQDCSQVLRLQFGLPTEDAEAELDAKELGMPEHLYDSVYCSEELQLRSTQALPMRPVTAAELRRIQRLPERERQLRGLQAAVLFAVSQLQAWTTAMPVSTQALELDARAAKSRKQASERANIALVFTKLPDWEHYIEMLVRLLSETLDGVLSGLYAERHVQSLAATMSRKTRRNAHAVLSTHFFSDEDEANPAEILLQHDVVCVFVTSSVLLSLAMDVPKVREVMRTRVNPYWTSISGVLHALCGPIHSVHMQPEHQSQLLGTDGRDEDRAKNISRTMLADSAMAVRASFSSLKRAMSSVLNSQDERRFGTAQPPPTSAATATAGTTIEIARDDQSVRSSTLSLLRIPRFGFSPSQWLLLVFSGKSVRRVLRICGLNDPIDRSDIALSGSENRCDSDNDDISESAADALEQSVMSESSVAPQGDD